MTFKVLCSDLDGTLLSTKNDVSHLTIEQINRISGTMQVILVSARMPSGMYYLQKRLNITHEPLICYNGALILEEGKALLSITIPAPVLEKLYELTLPFGIDLGLYVNDNWFVPNTSERVEKEIKYTKTKPIFQSTRTSLLGLKHTGAHKVMLMCTKQSADAIMPQLHHILGNKVHLYRSNDTLIEIAPKSVCKRSAIGHILKPTDSLQDVIAFGDNYNDIEMIKAVGFGVAVANARTEVKAIADHITLANTEHGVARFIQQQLHI